MQGFATYASEYGPVRVDWQDDAVVRLRIIPQADYDADGAGETTGLTDETFRELEQYFAGELRRFTVPIAFASGTPFQQAVWRALLQIPYGETRTYAQIAEAARGRLGEQPQPDSVHRAMPPRGRRERQSRRLCLWRGDEAFAIADGDAHPRAMIRN